MSLSYTELFNAKNAYKMEHKGIENEIKKIETDLKAIDSTLDQLLAARKKVEAEKIEADKKRYQNLLAEERKKLKNLRADIESATRALAKKNKDRKAIMPRGEIASGHEQSLMDHALHLANMNAESLAISMLLEMLWNGAELIFCVQYRKQHVEFKLARSMGNAYEPNAQGKWPEIFPCGSDGKPDYEQDPNVDGTASEELVIANNYVLPPNMQRAVHAQYAKYTKDMMGASYLSDYEAKVLLKMQPEASKEEDSSQKEYDLNYLRQQQPRPK